MITSLFTYAVNLIIPVVPACVVNTLAACANRVAKSFPNIAKAQNGSLVQAAQTGVKEFGKTFAVQTLGMQLGTYFPQEAIAARMILWSGQIAYRVFQRPQDLGEFDTLGTEVAAEIKGRVTGLTAATLTTVVLAYFYCTGSPLTASLAPLRYLLTLMGTASGGFVALWLDGKDPTDHTSPWYDNYINRNARFIMGQNAVQAIGAVIPSVTTVATAASRVLPGPLGSLLILSANVTATAPSAISRIFWEQAVGHAAYYAMPLSKVVYRVLYFKPTSSDYENLDPNLLIKTVINSLHGNSFALAQGLLADSSMVAGLKNLIAELVTKGVSQDHIVNLIVRSINEYAKLTQDGYIQVATKELSEAVTADEQTAKKDQLNRQLYSKIMGVALDKVPHNLSLPSYAQSIIQKALSEVEKQETDLLGQPLSDKVKIQALIETHGQGFLTLLLKKADQALKKPANPSLTEDEIRQFYLNLNQLVWAPLPQAIPQSLRKLLDIAILFGVALGEPVPRIMNSLLIEDADQVMIEEINDDEFGLTVQQEVATPPVAPRKNPSPPSEEILSPAKIVTTLINHFYGNPLALAEDLVSIPVFQNMSHQLVVKALKTNVLANTLVRSVNLFATILNHPEVKTAMQDLANAPTPAIKEAKKKALNHLIYSKIFSSLTMSCLERWVAYGTKSAVAKRIKPIVQKIISGLREKAIELLNKNFDETTLEVCLRGFIILNVLMTKKALTYQRKNLPLENHENAKFYPNLIDLTFAPFSHSVTDVLRQLSKTGLPLILNETSLSIPRLLTILNEASDPVSQILSETEFEGETPASPSPEKPFDPIRTVQKTWYKFVAALYYLVDHVQMSIKYFGKSFSPITPPVKTREPLPSKPQTGYTAARSWKLGFIDAHRKTLHSNRVRVEPRAGFTFKASQAWKMASTGGASGDERNPTRVR